jgi:hypothetical protein
MSRYIEIISKIKPKNYP